MGIPTGFLWGFPWRFPQDSYGNGMGMGAEIPFPRQPCLSCWYVFWIVGIRVSTTTRLLYLYDKKTDLLGAKVSCRGKSNSLLPVPCQDTLVTN